MSEVDRLRSAGLSPVLPIADKRGSREDPSRRKHDDAPEPGDPSAKPPDTAAALPHPPKSLIDDYA